MSLQGDCNKILQNEIVAVVVRRTNIIMIRNSRGNPIRRIVQKVQCTNHWSNKLTTTTVPDILLQHWRDSHTDHKYLCASTLSNVVPRRLQNKDPKSHHRWYNTGRQVLKSMKSTLKQQDKISITTSNSSNKNDDTLGYNDYTQAPDSGRIISPINVTEIYEFLSERLICIATRDSQRLRLIDEELENNHVFVDDMAKQWRADGKRFEVYLRKLDTNVADAAPNGTEEDHKNVYFRSPYSGPIVTTISESEIHQLLAERHYLRRIRDYENSDRIRTQLESHSIFIDDKHRKWRGDGTNETTPIHNYTMSRDSGPLKVNITEEEIHNLLNQRHRCRLRKDYKGADVIYEKLKNCGVSIDDELMEWRADGIKFSSFLRQHGYKLASDAGRHIAKASETDIHKLLAQHWSYKHAGNTKMANETWDVLSKIGVFLDVSAMEWRADGRKHNYRLTQDAGKNVSKVADSVIHYLLEKRMLQRWKKSFKASDRIRDKLKMDGVYIDDVNKEWRADGNGFDHLCHQYRLAPDSGPLISVLSEREIHKLLSELWQWKLSQCFDKSDLVYDKLFNAGIYVSDKKELWRGDGKTCNFEMMSTAGPFHTNGAIDEGQMHRMLEESFRLRLRQNFEPANQIHDQLSNMGVFLDLNQNLYRADGIMHSYQKSPLSGPITSHMKEEEVHHWLAERWQRKISQEFADADRIYDELYQSGVFVDDEAMEWRADGIYHTYRPTPDAGPISSTLPVDEIHTLIGKRMRHKKFRDFVKADLIMQYLRGAKVHLNDKKREWRADGVRYEILPTKQ